MRNCVIKVVSDDLHFPCKTACKLPSIMNYRSGLEQFYLSPSSQFSKTGWIFWKRKGNTGNIRSNKKIECRAKGSGYLSFMFF